MKPLPLLLALALAFTGRSQTSPDSAATDQTTATGASRSIGVTPTPEPLSAPSEAWQAKRRLAHETEWLIPRRLTNSINGKVRTVTNSLVELCANLNVPDAQGVFQPANSTFSLTDQGAIANGTAHKVRILADLASPDAIRVEKDGLVLASHPICIGIFDPADGRSYRLADITNSVGYLVSDSEIVFSNCFCGLRASVSYKNSLSGLSQQLLLEERPGITPEALGFSANSRIELFTEFQPDTPLPDTTDSFIAEGRLQAAVSRAGVSPAGSDETATSTNGTSTTVSPLTATLSTSGAGQTAMATNASPTPIYLRRELNTATRQTMVEPDFVDHNLTFNGKMRMGTGRAFSLDAQGNGGPGRNAIQVGKRFESIQDGESVRRVLIEAIEYRSAEPLMRALPVSPNHTILTNASIRIFSPHQDSPLEALNGSSRRKEALTAIAGNKMSLLTSAATRAMMVSQRSLPPKTAPNQPHQKIHNAMLTVAPPPSPGARPSSVAATPEHTSAAKLSSATESSTPAAPGDGRAPASTHVPSLVLDYELLSTDGIWDPKTFSSDVTYLCDGPVSIYSPATIQAGVCIKYAPYPDNASISFFGGIDWQTDVARPAVFTSKFDNSVGEILGTTESPATYFMAMSLSDSPSTWIKHVRVSYADWAIYAFGSMNVRHGQFTHCGNVFTADWGVCNVENALLVDVGNAFNGAPYTANGTHLTIDGCADLFTSYYDPSQCIAALTNCLLHQWAASDVEPVTDHSPTDGSSSPFQTVGGGNYYLPPDSPYRGDAAPINSTLAEDFQQMSTYAPIPIANQTISTSTALNPTVQRDINTLGYHYLAADLILAGITVNNSAVLLVTNGTVIAFDLSAASFGITLASGGQLISEGSPLKMNQFLRTHNFQEAAAPAVSGVPANFVPSYPTLPGISAKFRFTDFPMMAANYEQFYSDHSGWYFNDFTLQDCQVRGGRIDISPTTTSQTITWRNNLFERVSIDIYPYADFSLTAINNTFAKGSLSFAGSGLTPFPWSFYENIFDQISIDQGRPIYSQDYNSYDADFDYLYPWSEDNVVTQWDGPGFVTGPLGHYYLDPSSLCVDAGYEGVEDSGLFHFTTRVDQQKDTGNVDLGFHFAALAPRPPGQDIPWIDDSTPAGANAEGWGDTWDWIGTSPSPYHGSLAHQSSVVPYVHQHYTYNINPPFEVQAGDQLFCYVYVDPNNPPVEVELQFLSDDSWEHRAYWGENALWPGTQVGPLPAAGQWQRLEVPASAVGLEGHAVTGMAFSLPNGRVTWDYAGKCPAWPKTLSDFDGDSIADIIEDPQGYGTYVPGLQRTDWTKADTDGDGLPDAYEINVTHTAPNSIPGDNSDANSDIDHDGLTNLEEYKLNTDPYEADVIPPRLQPAGGIYSTPQTITVSCFTEGATIHYTLDGTEPNVASPVVASGGQIPGTINSPTTIKVKAWKTGLISSKTTTAQYSLSVAIPVLSPATGVYDPGLQVSIAAGTPGSIIRYTLDGSDPTPSSSIYTEGAAISVSGITTVKARAWAGGVPSATAASTYVVRAAPTLPANDLFAHRRSLSGVSGATRGSNVGGDLEAAEVCSGYFSDASQSVWFQWLAPNSGTYIFDTFSSGFDTYLKIFQGNGLGTCMEDMTFLDQNDDSGFPGDRSSLVAIEATSGQTYQIALNAFSSPGDYLLYWYPGTQVMTPAISNPGGTFKTTQTATLTCNLPRASLRYTIDGTDPTEQSRSITSGSTITITRSLTLKARAWQDNLSPSEVAVATFIIDPNASSPTPVVAAPAANPSTLSFSTTLNITLSSATAGAIMHYTTDGSDPLESSASVASGSSITISDSTKLKMKAFKAGMNPSSAETFLYAKANTDTDNDGVPDSWELAVGSDMFVPDALAVSPAPFAHGLNNLQVYLNPSVLIEDNHSTAGDGIADWWKVQYGFSLTDAFVGASPGANGMSLADSYQNVWKPNDPNSRLDVMTAPSCAIQMGPQNHLYLTKLTLPAGASHLRLLCTEFAEGAGPMTGQFNIDFILPSDTLGTLLIPPNRLTTERHYGFQIQVWGSDGQMSPPATVGSFLNAYYGFVDFSNDIRELAKWRMRFAGSGNWRTPYDPPDPHYIGLPYRNQFEHTWLDSWGKNIVHPRPTTPQEIYIGTFQAYSDVNGIYRDSDMYWDGPASRAQYQIIYPGDIALQRDHAFDPWNLFAEHISADLDGFFPPFNESLQFFIDSYPAANEFHLSSQSFRFEFPDGSFTLTPGQTVVLPADDIAVEPKVFKTVENATTSVTDYLFCSEPPPSPSDFPALDGLGCYPDYPGTVSQQRNPAVESPAVLMDVLDTVRVNGFSKEAILRANGNAVAGQFLFIQQYFDKAFICDQLTGDVPRTSEDNVGGKKKIDLNLAVRSGLLSPYGDFTPTNSGKYILTTKPNLSGQYGECTVYVGTADVVTRDPDEGVQRPVDDTVYTSVPVPSVNLHLVSATIDGNGSLQIQVSARVIDRLSEVADDPSERLQQLKFILNGQVLETIDNLPALSPGQGVLPWQPHRLDVTVQRTFTVPDPGGSAVILRAETSENAAGNVGWDDVGVRVGLDSLPFSGGADPVVLSFPQAPTSAVVDSLQIYFGNRAPQTGDPTCTENSATSLFFNGSINISGSLRPCTAAILGPLTFSSSVVDRFDAEIIYQMADGSSRSLLGNFVESSANSLRFVNNFGAPGSTAPGVWLTQELDGSPPGSFEPILARFDIPQTIVDSAAVAASLNDVPQPIAPFTFSPMKYYLVLRGDEDKPRLVMVTATAEKLPPGLGALTPENIRFTEVDGELKFQVVLPDGTEVTDVDVKVFNDDFGVKPLQSGAPGPLTPSVLYTFYRLLYGDAGQQLLHYYQAGNNVIEVSSLFLRKKKHEWRTGPQAAIIIDPSVDPVQGATLLWAELNSTMGWAFVRNNVLEEDPELFLRGVNEAGREATRVGIATANMVLTGLTIVNEGANIAVTCNDLAEGHYAAAIGFLPFVPSGARFILKHGDGRIIGDFASELASRVSTMLGKPTRIERLENLGQALKSGDVTIEMMEAFIKGGYVRLYSKDYNRKLLRQELLKQGAAPAHLKYPQAHHDLPLEFIEFFLSHGLDPNKAAHGRWVEGTRKGSSGLHQVWTPAFNEEWRIWIGNNREATVDEILDQMTRMRQSGRYP